ncbi:MAG: ABC transporter substrate-binding protein [Planctomycetes bacterium]|nr:ABC transporter substrate-binding protein [Planctomycetota bacterium]
MKRLGCILFVFLTAGQCISAADKNLNDPNEALLARCSVAIGDPNNPNELLRATWDSVVNVLKIKNLDPKVKENLVDKIISPIFDFALMGKLALGRTNWPKLDASQREKFTALFVERLKASYREKIMRYQDEKVLFQPAVKNKDNIQIPMTLISNDTKYAMLYKLRRAGESWKVYDVEIEGVSILLTYRSQFNDTLSRGTVDDLLSQLEKTAGS